MKHQLSKITVRDTAEALRIAEAQIERPEATDGGPVFIQVRPQDIQERLELFQPRRPGYGTRELDTKYVGKLKTRIERKGEMDPVVVVKLKTVNPYTGKTDGTEWVVIDGHHRKAAYLKAKWNGTIKCEWFVGTAREAMDASLDRNEKIHLEVDQGDKGEAAWTRTLLDWNGKSWSTSKRDVVKLTGCGEGSVAEMRRVVKWHHNHRTGKEKHPTGEMLNTTLGPDLRVHSWNKVKQTKQGLTPKEWDANEAAAKMSRNLTLRMSNTLAEDPEVTARALWLYDRDMCPKLVQALQAHIRAELDDERSLESQAVNERSSDGD